MGYLVIKKVKGHSYLYRQKSYRVGGKVKTISEYVGPVSGVGGSGALTAAAKSAVEKRLEAAIRPQERTVADPGGDGAAAVAKDDPEDSADGGVITTKQPPRFRCTIDLAGRVSETRLERESIDFLERMTKRGIDARDVPPLHIKRGRKLGHALRGGTMTVTVPRGDGANRNEIRKEVYRAQAQGMLGAIARAKPERFLELSLQFDESFRKTNEMLWDWVRHTRAKSKFAKYLCLRWWGNVAQLERALPGQEAGKIGLTDLSRRGGWEEEVAGVYAAMQMRGRAAFFKEQEKEIRMAQAFVVKAEAGFRDSLPLSPKRARAKAKLHRARARLAAVAEMRKKALMIQKTFF